MSENNLFPRRSEIIKGSIRDVRDSVARPSLDTFYQVNFSFGKFSTWLKDSPVKDLAVKRSQGRNFMQKMSILCTQAEIPGTSYVESTAIGHHQGIQETFPNLRNFPPLNLSFYVDADHVVLEVLERWMEYINPVKNGVRSEKAYTRFNYPEDYKEKLHVTKFERDSFIKESRGASYQSQMSSYEFINVWPSNLTSMRVAYGDSNVLRCAIQFAYDRFITKFNYPDTQSQVLRKSNANSKEIRQSDLDFDDPNRILNRGSSFAGRFSEENRTSNRNEFVQQGY